MPLLKKEPKPNQSSVVSEDMIPNLVTHSAELEESILRCVLFDPQAIQFCVETLPVEAFATLSYRTIYKESLSLHDEGKAPDLMTLLVRLTEKGLIDSVGGQIGLSRLADGTISAIHLNSYISSLKEKHTRRQLVEAAQKIREKACSPLISVESCLSSADKTIRQVLDGAATHSESQTAFDVGEKAYAELFKERKRVTGLYDLDSLLGGLFPGELSILAGRPSMGKSAIALSIALKQCVQYKDATAYFSLELTKEQMAYRLWSLISASQEFKEIGLRRLTGRRLKAHRTGSFPFSDTELENIALLQATAETLPLYFNGDRGITVAGIAQECRKIKARHGLGLIVVDYVQLMSSYSSEGNRAYEIGSIVRDLYRLAGEEELDCPILLLSQCNRQVEGRNDKRPLMGDLGQSGVLEQVADNVIFAYRDDYYDRESSDFGLCELIVRKARNGDTGTAKFLFDREVGLLENLVKEREQ